MIKKRNIPEYFNNHTIMLELQEIRNQEPKSEIGEEFEREIKEYSVDLIERVKLGEGRSFEELMKIKDMRNFLYHHTHYIRKYHQYVYNQVDVLGEMRTQIFYHVSKNYRIYNEPHEISLLINSMRNWIRLKVSKELSKTHFPKGDGVMDHEYFEFEYEGDDSYFYVEDLVNRHLDEEEKTVLDMKIYDEMTFREIGAARGYSKDTAQRTYYKALKQIMPNVDI